MLTLKIRKKKKQGSILTYVPFVEWFKTILWGETFQESIVALNDRGSFEKARKS